MLEYRSLQLKSTIAGRPSAQPFGPTIWHLEWSPVCSRTIDISAIDHGSAQELHAHESYSAHVEDTHLAFYDVCLLPYVYKLIFVFLHTFFHFQLDDKLNAKAKSSIALVLAVTTLPVMNDLTLRSLK